MSEFRGSEGTRGARATEGDAYLSQWDAQSELRRWTLPSHRDVVTIGRIPSADVSLSWDTGVSRVHATVEQVGGEWTVVDEWPSRNGTFVNGRRIVNRVWLRDGDEIRAGSTVLRFHAPQAAIDQTAREPEHQPDRNGGHVSPERRVQLLSVLLLAAAVEVVGLSGNATTTFVVDRVDSALRWAVPPVIAVLVAVAKAFLDLVGQERPAPPRSDHGAGAPPGHRGTPALAAILVVLVVVGVGGFAVTAGVRYAVGYVTGKESGEDRLVQPATGCSGGLALTVEHVVYTRHFTRVDLAIRNTGEATVNLPLFGFCIFTGDDGTTLQADSFRSQWSTTVPPGALQRGTVTFGGKLPDGVSEASLSFTTVFGVGGGDALTVRNIELRPSSASPGRGAAQTGSG